MAASVWESWQLCTRLFAVESSQRAAIIPNRAVLENPGGTAQLVCLLGS